MLELTFLLLLIAAAVSDLWRFRIPNSLCLALVVLFLLNGVFQPHQIDWIGHLAAGGIVLVCGFGLFAVGGVGAGDVKFLAAVATWFGMSLLGPLIVITTAAGLAVMLVLLGLRRWAPLPASARIPQALRPGKRIPYAVPIALAAGLLTQYVPPGFWLI